MECALFALALLILPFIGPITRFFEKGENENNLDDMIEQSQREERARNDRMNEFYYGVWDKHLNVLLNKRKNLVHKNEYGVEDLTAFKRELEYFIDNVFAPEHKKWVDSLDYLDKWQMAEEEIEQKAKWKKLQIENLVTYVEDVYQTPDIQRQVAEIARESEEVPDDPHEYEHFVARILKRHGWQSRATQGSGDQGADVIAEKDGFKLIIQCKKYKKPVGNKAV